jgi:hypothetical protein
MHPYFQPTTVRDLTFERWDMVKGYMSGDKAAVDWANDWPQAKLVKW